MIFFRVEIGRKQKLENTKQDYNEKELNIDDKLKTCLKKELNQPLLKMVGIMAL